MKAAIALMSGCPAALALLLGSFAATAGEEPGAALEKAAQRYITESETAWAESVATSDSSVVERILADDVVWVLDGKVLNKAQAVADAAAGPGDFLSNHLDYAHVRIFGDTAVVQGAETWTRKGGRTGRFVWADTWLRRNGRWQIVMAEDVSVRLAKRGSP
jgi:ketosteroid isomerase-like protein